MKLKEIVETTFLPPLSVANDGRSDNTFGYSALSDSYFSFIEESGLYRKAGGVYRIHENGEQANKNIERAYAKVSSKEKAIKLCWKYYRSCIANKRITPKERR